MAVPELTSSSPGSTGNATITLSSGSTPVGIEAWVGPRSSTTETVNMASFGYVDITNGNATWQSNYTDGTGSQTKNGVGGSTTSSLIQHYNRSGGVLTKIIDIKFVSVAAGTFTINVVTANVNYTVYYKVYY